MINLYIYHLLDKLAAHLKIFVCLVHLICSAGIKTPVLLNSDEEETGCLIRKRWYESFVVLRNG